MKCVVLLLLAVFCVANAQLTNYFGIASSANEVQVPAVNVSGTGNVVATVEVGSSTLVVVYSVSGLSSNLNAIHIHGPALTTANAGIVATICATNCRNTGSKTIVATDIPAGSTLTTVAQIISAIQNGRAYVNFHTTDFPNGELRANLAPLASPSASVSTSASASASNSTSASASSSNSTSTSTSGSSTSASSTSSTPTRSATPTGFSVPIFMRRRRV